MPELYEYLSLIWLDCRLPHPSFPMAALKDYNAAKRALSTAESACKRAISHAEATAKKATIAQAAAVKSQAEAEAADILAAASAVHAQQTFKAHAGDPNIYPPVIGTTQKWMEAEAAAAALKETADAALAG